MFRHISRRWLPLPLLLGWCGFLFFYGLNAGELYRTESLRAIIAAECLRNGDWIVPTLYGQPLFTKPPGMYVAIALCSWPSGEVSQWSARLPSALAATVIVLLFYWFFARQLGRLAGLLTAIMLPMSLFWIDKVPSAEIDMLQVAWVSAALLFFLRALEAEETSPGGFARLPAAFCCLALLCVAGGVLTKWTAPVFFYGTVIPLLGWRGRLRWLWSWPHLVSAVGAGGLCLAWAGWAAYLTDGTTLWNTVSREALQHLSPGHHAETVRQLGAHHHDRLNYGGQALLLPLQILAMTLPWSAVALWSLRPGFYRQLDERGQRLFQALHCWLWPNLVLWSLLPDPSPRHAAPLVPAITGLAALVIASRVAKRPQHVASRPFIAILTACLLLWIGVKIVFVHWVMPARADVREARAKGERLAELVPDRQMLYLFCVKDEGIMFYYGRPVRRLEAPTQLPASAEPTFCILTEAEWQHWPASRSAETLLRMKDEQGAPMVLVKVRHSSSNLESGGQ